MNKIQEAMKRKVANAMGEVEYQIDCFMDNNYKSNFKMDKYLKQLGFKKRLVLMMKDEFNPQLEELQSDEEQLIEGYSFMTKPQKKRFVQFLLQMQEGCDKYIALNESKWKADTQLKRIRNKAKKKHQERLAEIEANKGRKFRQ